MGSSYEEVTSAFGEPEKYQTHFSEIDEDSILVISYTRSKFKFLNDKLRGFELRDDKFKITPYDLSVGTASDRVINAFPKSFENREVRSGAIWMWVSLYDTSIIFILENGLISEILTHNPS